ncbi:MAG: threonine aldolase, partial [Treponema sp.]|jgi:threonine aldolase|nr:threonine aldolase [Treponema sp.]
MCCLSKGLCAPVGSLLAGTADFVKEARLRRKIMGGGMRQAGILAAAGILALTEQPRFLPEDHARARRLEAALGNIRGVSVTPGDINMVFFRYPPAREPERAERITDRFREKNILINPPEGDLFRLVTHYWIGGDEEKIIRKTAEEAFKG